MSERTAGGLLLDTDVASFLFNSDPIRAPRYQALVGESTLFLAFSSVAEMLFGAEMRDWGTKRKDRLEAYFHRHVIVHSNPSILKNWATIRIDGRRRGRMIERQDAWVAAVALALNVPLVTHNAAHFSGIPTLQLLTAPD